MHSGIPVREVGKVVITDYGAPFHLKSRHYVSWGTVFTEMFQVCQPKSVLGLSSMDYFLFGLIYCKSKIR